MTDDTAKLRPDKRYEQMTKRYDEFVGWAMEALIALGLAERGSPPDPQLFAELRLMYLWFRLDGATDEDAKGASAWVMSVVNAATSRVDLDAEIRRIESLVKSLRDSGGPDGFVKKAELRLAFLRSQRPT